MILAGDIGGTKTVLALFTPAPELHRVACTRYQSSDYGSLEEILAQFQTRLQAGEWGPVDLDGACFGVAGPVLDQQVETTNLPWETVDASALSAALGGRPVRLLNDLAAMALGMVHLAGDELAVLHGAEAQRGNVAVIAPGTGLGEAMLFWDGDRFHPVASEAGHADFAPRSEREFGLLRYLQGKQARHVSWERVLSGPGLASIYAFLRDSTGADEPPWLRSELERGGSEAISRIGLENRHPLCADALEMFTQLLGAEAGNQALRCLATGGVFLGGGIVKDILPALQKFFLPRFLDKGRFKDLLRAVPVSVALRDDAPLRGAAHHFLKP